MPGHLPVKITNGLSNWQVVQRSGEFAVVSISGTCSLSRSEGEVCIRVVCERGERVIANWTPVPETDSGFWRYELSLPTGGPYRIETCFKMPGLSYYDTLAGESRTHIFAGDNYLIAGQSNAVGYAKDQYDDAPIAGVEMFGLNGQWTVASHPINDGTDCRYDNLDIPRTGHSPWLRFGAELYARSGVPVGLIPAALGGSPIEAWLPGGMLHENSLRMIRDCGGICAVIWYQGCTNAMNLDYEGYEGRFLRVVSGYRETLNMPQLPFYTCQLNGCDREADTLQDISWSAIRSAQESAARRSRIFMLPTFGLPLWDEIHNSSGSNLSIGEQMSRLVMQDRFKADETYSPLRVMDITPGKGNLSVRIGPVRGALAAGSRLLEVIRVYSEQGELPVEKVSIREDCLALCGEGLESACLLSFGQVRNGRDAGIYDTFDSRVLAPFCISLTENEI